MVVWDVVTVTELRTLPPVAPTERDGGVAWSQDGNFLARTVTKLEPEAEAGSSIVEVYSLPEVVLTERTTIRAPQGVIDLSWAPARCGRGIDRGRGVGGWGSCSRALAACVCPGCPLALCPLPPL